MSGFCYFVMWKTTASKISRRVVEDTVNHCDVFFRARVISSLHDKSRIKPKPGAVPGQTKLSMITFEKAQRFIASRLPVEFLGVAVDEEDINGSRFLKIRVLNSNGKEGSHQMFCFVRICDTSNGPICRGIALSTAV